MENTVRSLALFIMILSVLNIGLIWGGSTLWVAKVCGCGGWLVALLGWSIVRAETEGP